MRRAELPLVSGLHGWQPDTLLIAVVVLALSARLGVAMLTNSWVFPSDDNFWSFGYEMGQIAASLAMGNGFSWPEWSAYPPGPTAWMPPMYPLIMAGFFKIFGMFSVQAAVALELFLTAMSVLTCIWAFVLGKHLYNAAVGLVAAFLLAIYPPSVRYAVQNLWDTSLFTSCLLLIILMCLKLSRHPTVKQGIMLGSTLGFTALVNPTILSTLPFAIVWLYLKANGTRGTVIKAISVMLLTFGLVISPWIIRNYVIFGRFLFIKSNFGHELYKGNNEHGLAEIDSAITITNRIVANNARIGPVFTEAETAFLEQANEAARNQFLLGKAASFIAEHPLRFVRQTIKRFALFWTYMKPYGGWQARFTLTIYFSILILAGAGLVLSRNKGHDVALVLLFLLALPLPYYFTVVTAFRYRYPIEPLLVIFAAYSIHWLVTFGGAQWNSDKTQ
jgi:4-amino-4-deoxy-L-arabinose transferase-like glycosyltransferase